jgi:hypothetical protein
MRNLFFILFWLGLTIYPDLVSNARYSCLCLPSAGITGMYHHIWSFLLLINVIYLSLQNISIFVPAVWCPRHIFGLTTGNVALNGFLELSDEECFCNYKILCHFHCKKNPKL